MRVDNALRSFGSAVAELDGELNWELLGRAACEGDGSEFYDSALREAIVDTGLRLVQDLGQVLDPSGGRSLYLGAEVAEFPIIFAEHLVLGRHVEWLNLACAQTAELARAIQVVEARLGLALPRPRAESLDLIEPRSCNHLWLVSVLTDPEHFPALHDELYERAHGPLATGRGSLEDDRRRAHALVSSLLTRAAPGCVLTTTDEELGFVEPLLKQRGLVFQLVNKGRLSAVVGDQVRIGRIQPRAES